MTMKKLILIGTLGFMIALASFSCSNKKSVEDIQVVNSNQRNLYHMSVTEVEVKNNTDKLLTTGSIKVVYRDKTNKIVGTGLGMIFNLPAGEKSVVTCAAANIIGASKYDVQIEPMHYE